MVSNKSRCVHELKFTGRVIEAVFGKTNLPEGGVAVHSIGQEAKCKWCPAVFIVHHTNLKFCEKITELERSQYV